MRIAQQCLVTVLALFSAVVLTIASTLSLAVALAATALIVPGTGTPNANIVGGYLENARDYYIAPFNPACTKANNCALQGINYPAQFWPIPLAGWGGLSGAKWDVSTGTGLTNLNSALVSTLAQNPANTPVVIFGYSQGGNIVSREKALLSGLPKNQTYLSFVMIGNINRPNGGLFERLALLGHVPILDATFGLPAPTDTCDHVCATDIAFQYDGVADFPLYPLNALASLNAIAGFWYVHGTYLAPNAHSDVGELPDDYTPAELAAALANPANQTVYGDTRYVTVPTRTLPIVRPFLEFGNATGTSFVIKPLVDLLAPLLRVLIDLGYDRTLSPGVPAPFRLIPSINPITLVADVIRALGEGVNAALSDLGVHPNVAPNTVTPNLTVSAANTLAKTTTSTTSTGAHDTVSTDTVTAATDTKPDVPESTKKAAEPVTEAAQPATKADPVPQVTDLQVVKDTQVTKDAQVTDIQVTKDAEVTKDAQVTGTQVTKDIPAASTHTTTEPKTTATARPKVREPIGSDPGSQGADQSGEKHTTTPRPHAGTNFTPKAVPNTHTGTPTGTSGATGTTTTTGTTGSAEKAAA